MNLPNAVNSQYYQSNRNDLTDYAALSTNFDNNDKHKVESRLQLDKSEKFPPSIRQNDLCHFGYEKCFDTDSIDYRTNNLNFNFENVFETNTTIDQQCTQPIAYHTNYEGGNQPPIGMGKF